MTTVAAIMRKKLGGLGLVACLLALMVVVVASSVVRGLVTGEIGCGELCRWVWRRDWDEFLSRVLVVSGVFGQ